jgi:cation:H+ antiporter
MINAAGAWAPALAATIFLAASLLMIWRLESLGRRGLDGTALGALVMPYCSGLGNLVFVFALAKAGGPSGEVLVNALVNNVTNFTLLLGLPALLWGLSVMPGNAAKGRKGRGGLADAQISRLSLMLSLTAALFFAGIVWALSRDGRLDFGDGLALVSIFAFWQCFQVFDALKDNVRKGRSFGFGMIFDVVLLALGAWALYVSVDWLVAWLSARETGFFSANYLGWVTGWLMVLPNALLAFYYGWRRRADVVLSSQVGDGHICIPLCIGLFAIFRPIPVPAFLDLGLALVAVAALGHIALLLMLGRLPRWSGALLIAAYGWFVYAGLLTSGS